MNKIKLSVIALVASLTASATFANSNSLANYYTSLRSNHTPSLKTMAHPPTDITVINASTNGIYISIPNSPVNDYINAGYNDHIYNTDPNIWSTFIVLSDPYHNVFYSASVCRLAILTVYGRPSNYRINLDTDLCG